MDLILDFLKNLRRKLTANLPKKGLHITAKTTWESFSKKVPFFESWGCWSPINSYCCIQRPWVKGLHNNLRSASFHCVLRKVNWTGTCTVAHDRPGDDKSQQTSREHPTVDAWRPSDDALPFLSKNGSDQARRSRCSMDEESGGPGFFLRLGRSPQPPNPARDHPRGG